MLEFEKIKALALDLQVVKPRRPSELLGGIKGAARTLDKCRATLVGLNGDYEFDCPFDRRWFSQHGITSDAFRNLVSSGANDEEVAAWLVRHARPSALAS